MLQEAAGGSAESLGFSVPRLLQDGVSWVLARFRLTMSEWPAWRNELQVLTWPSGTDVARAETIFRAVRERMPTVSLDTVYRTLWVLHDLGLVTTLGPRRHGVRFDANLDRHHHYVCVRCGLVRDFESESLNELRVPAAAKRLGSVVDAHVEVRGLCARCQRKRAAATPRPEPRKRSKP